MNFLPWIAGGAAVGRRRTLDPNEARIARGVLYLPDRAPMQVSRLGKGMFAQAWLGSDNKVYLDVDESAYEKEILSEISAVTRSKHLPTAVSLGFTDRGRLYQMPLYSAPLRACICTAPPRSDDCIL